MADTAEASGADHQQQPSQRNRVVDTVNEKAQEVFKEDYAQAREHVTNAAKSRSYLYPIKARKSQGIELHGNHLLTYHISYRVSSTFSLIANFGSPSSPSSALWSSSPLA
jgi:hypothetical protein